MLGMGPILWRVALKRTYPYLPSAVGGIPPVRREALVLYASRHPAAVLYYKMIDRAWLNLPIL